MRLRLLSLSALRRRLARWEASLQHERLSPTPLAPGPSGQLEPVPSIEEEEAEARAPRWKKALRRIAIRTPFG